MAFLKRMYELLLKVVSVKGLIFIIATSLMFCGAIESWMWSFFAAGFVGIRTLEKMIELLKGRGNG